MVKFNLLSKKTMHIIVLLFLGMISYFVDLKLWSNGVLLLLIYVYAIYSWVKVTHQITSLYFMFLLYCMLSNVAQTFLYTMGVNFEGIVDIYNTYSNEWINKMISFQGLCIVFLAMGALVFYKPDAFSKKMNVKSLQNNRDDVVVLDIRDFLYICLLLIMMVSYVIKLFSRSSMNYHDFFYGDDTSTGVDVRLTIAFCCFLYTSYYNHVNDKFRKFIYITSVTLSVIMMMVGSRSHMMPILFGLLFVKSMTERTLPKLSLKFCLKWGSLTIVLLYILQVFKILRGYSISEWNSTVLAEAFGAGILEGLVNILVEMGGSARCIIVTMMKVDGGSVVQENTLLNAILKALMPVDWIHSLGLATEMQSLSLWVTAAGGGIIGVNGWGYSIIAEMYFNFGFIGFWGMFLFGSVWILLERFVKWLSNNGQTIAAMGIVYFLSYAIFLSRAELTLVSSSGRYALYILTVSVIILKVFRLKITGIPKLKLNR